LNIWFGDWVSNDEQVKFPVNGATRPGPPERCSRRRFFCLPLSPPGAFLHSLAETKIISVFLIFFLDAGFFVDDIGLEILIN